MRHVQGRSPSESPAKRSRKVGAAFPLAATLVALAMLGAAPPSKPASTPPLSLQINALLQVPSTADGPPHELLQLLETPAQLTASQRDARIETVIHALNTGLSPQKMRDFYLDSTHVDDSDVQEATPSPPTAAAVPLNRNLETCNLARSLRKRLPDLATRDPAQAAQCARAILMLCAYNSVDRDAVLMLYKYTLSSDVVLKAAALPPDMAAALRKQAADADQRQTSYNERQTPCYDALDGIGALPPGPIPPALSGKALAALAAVRDDVLDASQQSDFANLLANYLRVARFRKDTPLEQATLNVLAGTSEKATEPAFKRWLAEAAAVPAAQLCRLHGYAYRLPDGRIVPAQLNEKGEIVPVTE